MCRITSRQTLRFRLAIDGTLAMLVLVGAGCQEPVPETSGTPPTVTPTTAATTERGEVELTSATAEVASLDEDLTVARFQIHYRFTVGSPTKFYLCEIAFPGTDRWGTKPLDAEDLQSAGVIKTTIEVGDSAVDSFEVTLLEADSPDQGFHLISNKLAGQVQPSDPAP